MKTKLLILLSLFSFSLQAQKVHTVNKETPAIIQDYKCHYLIEFKFQSDANGGFGKFAIASNTCDPYSSDMVRLIKAFYKWEYTQVEVIAVTKISLEQAQKEIKDSALGATVTFDKPIK